MDKAEVARVDPAFLLDEVTQPDRDREMDSELDRVFQDAVATLDGVIGDASAIKDGLVQEEEDQGFKPHGDLPGGFARGDQVVAVANLDVPFLDVVRRYTQGIVESAAETNPTGLLTVAFNMSFDFGRRLVRVNVNPEDVSPRNALPRYKLPGGFHERDIVQALRDIYHKGEMIVPGGTKGVAKFGPSKDRVLVVFNILRKDGRRVSVNVHPLEVELIPRAA